MSLRRCPECRKKVSDQASYCLRCGYPFRKGKASYKQSVELEEIENTLKAIRSDLHELHRDELNENSISIKLFKMGIIVVLVMTFLVLFVSTIIHTFNAFAENALLCSVALTVTIIVCLLVVALSILADLEGKYPKIKKAIKGISDILCCIVLLYISLTALAAMIFDMFIQNDTLVTCTVCHMLFGCLGLTFSFVIQEVWHTKDKSFIFAFVALVWALVVSIITK